MGSHPFYSARRCSQLMLSCILAVLGQPSAPEQLLQKTLLQGPAAQPPAAAAAPEPQLVLAEAELCTGWSTLPLPCPLWQPRCLHTASFRRRWLSKLMWSSLSVPWARAALCTQRPSVRVNASPLLDCQSPGLLPCVQESPCTCQQDVSAGLPFSLQAAQHSSILMSNRHSYQGSAARPAAAR